MLPFIPEQTSSLRERYPRALEDVYDDESIKIGTQLEPTKVRKQVFDFTSGVRLAVSRHSLRQPVLHLSASLVLNENREIRTLLLAAKRAGGEAGCLDKFREIAEAHFRLLAGESQLEFLGYTQGLIPHWKVILHEDSRKQDSPDRG